MSATPAADAYAFSPDVPSLAELCPSCGLQRHQGTTYAHSAAALESGANFEQCGDDFHEGHDSPLSRRVATLLNPNPED